MALADTIWTPNSGIGDYMIADPINIVDPTGVFLADASDNSILIVDTGATYLPVPTTVWSSNEGT